MTKLDYISLGLIFFSILVITLGIIKIHTYPEKVARARCHPQADAIGVTSLLGLIAFPLWMFALIWAYSGAVIGKLYEVEERQASATRAPSKPAPNGKPPATGKRVDPPVDKRV